MKRILIVIMTALLITVFAACAKQETPSAQTESPQASQGAQIANPWKDAKDAAEVKEMTGLEMGSLPEGATDVTSVSYTHLDVYKRQGPVCYDCSKPTDGDEVHQKHNADEDRNRCRTVCYHTVNLI